MRKIDLTPYTVKVMRAGEIEDSPYMLRESIAAALFVPGLNLGPVGLLKNNKIASKILDCPTNSLLLEEDEYQSLKAGFEVATGFNQNDVEMVERVWNAPEVPVVEAVP